jgi:hypothetical protein
LAAMDILMTTLPSAGRFALCIVTHVLVLEVSSLVKCRKRGCTSNGLALALDCV